ncbi:HEXXH motif domain-containing protein [Streptacidiphilus griseoplanus]|uniref:HEXXH motif domain-containing protein n=1 Tax=Peterkaempfera griseoplana TaxID=66896 RepID=UPI0006E13429|nr:HEXXH motif domain-containing protein [Peterkaempfera griseoplana]
MNGAPRVHRLTAGDFDELAAGRPTPMVLGTLRSSQLSRRLLTLHAIAALARERMPDPWRESGAERAWGLLAEVDRIDRPSLEHVLMHPPLGVLFSRCLRRLSGAAAGLGLKEDLSRLGEVAAAAALHAQLPCTLDLPAPGGLLTLPTWGVARLPAGTRRAHVEGRVISAPGFAVEVTGGMVDPPPGVPGWLPLRRLSIALSEPSAPRLHVALEDGVPESGVPSRYVTGRLTQRQVAEREASLRAAWGLLCAHLPERAAACAALCKCIVPLAPPAGRWVSATSREAFGAIGLSSTDDPARLAEALMHEVSHVALGALDDMVDLCDPDCSSRYRVGWRPDPRPLGAVIHGTYAHLAALKFREHHLAAATGAAAARSARRYGQLRVQVLDALNLLDSCPGLTSLGRRFCAAMAAAVTPESLQATPRNSNG